MKSRIDIYFEKQMKSFRKSRGYRKPINPKTHNHKQHMYTNVGLGGRGLN